MSEAQLMAGHPDYARAARLNHFDSRAVVHAQLVKPVNLMWIAHDLADFGRLSGR